MGDGNYVLGYEIHTEYIDALVEGASVQSVFTDSTGKLVMVSGAPLEIEGLDWACVTKLDLQEAIVRNVTGTETDYFAAFIEKMGFYDLFMIHPEGTIFYTVAREADYGTNLIDGPYADSGLGELFQRVMRNKGYEMQDYAPYAPSGNEPAGFLGTPIMNADG